MTQPGGRTARAEPCARPSDESKTKASARQEWFAAEAPDERPAGITAASPDPL